MDERVTVSAKEEQELPEVPSDEDETEEMEECLASVETSYEHDDVPGCDEDQMDECSDSEKTGHQQDEPTSDDDEDTDVLDIIDFYTSMSLHALHVWTARLLLHGRFGFGLCSYTSDQHTVTHKDWCHPYLRPAVSPQDPVRVLSRIGCIADRLPADSRTRTKARMGGDPSTSPP